MSAGGEGARRPGFLRRLARRVLVLVVLVALAGAGYLAVTPAPVRTAAWSPPAAPALEGATAVNQRLLAAERLALGQVDGPEGVAVDAAGRLYGGTADGRIVRLTFEGEGRTKLDTFATTGGRPLGLQFDAEGHLLVADAYKGLLRIDPAGRVTTLLTECDGVPLRFTDDMDVARDGTIYLSDASARFALGDEMLDVISGEPNGRLLAYDPATRTARTVLGGLYFANGVALARDDRFVIVTETSRYQIRRLWLSGPKKGESDVFAANLPGFPDGATSTRRGAFWIAMFTVRDPLLDLLHPRPFLKDQLGKLPRPLWPKPARYGLVLKLDEDGRVLESLHDPSGQHVPIVTSAEEVEGFLYLGTLRGRWMARLRLGE